MQKINWKRSLWKADCFFALHQRLCWLFMALLAGLTAWRLQGIHSESTQITAIVLLIILMITVWKLLEQAPYRAAQGWMALRRIHGPKAALAFMDRLEKKLPRMKQKEMAFFFANYRAFLLFETGRQQEAIDLLKNFKAIWNDEQKKMLQTNIDGLERIMQEQAGKQEE